VLKSIKHFDYGEFEIKQTRSALLVKPHLAKRCAEDEDASNNSMDVRAKQRLCYLTCLLTFSGLGGGFAPRHLSRSPPCGGKAEIAIAGFDLKT